MSKKRTVYVPVGLPGAGKTMYFNTLTGVKRVNMDKFIKGKLANVLPDVLKEQGDLYLDGLFLTKQVQDRIIATGENIVFIYFEPDRVACMWNDALRDRDIKSYRTIELAEVHKPDECIKQITRMESI